MSDLVGNPEYRFSHNEAQVNSRMKVKGMQRSGTEAIRTQYSKPKREITNIANSQNTKITCGQPSEQLFPKATETDLKII